MSQHHGGGLLDYIRSSVAAACEELAERLGKPLESKVAAPQVGPPGQWAESLGGQALLAVGSVAGQAEGPVAILVAAPAVLRIAAAVGEEGAEEGRESLREADTAAVLFLLARLGRKAGEVALGSFGIHLAWPSDPASFSAQVLDLSEGAEPLAAAVGEEDCWGFEVSLGEPLGASFSLLVSEALARSLERALAGGGRAADLARVLPVAVPLRVVVGRRRMALRDLLRLVPGQTLELEKGPDEPLELEAGGKPIARGMAVQADDRLAIRIVEVVQRPSRQP